MAKKKRKPASRARRSSARTSQLRPDWISHPIVIGLILALTTAWMVKAGHGHFKQLWSKRHNMPSSVAHRKGGASSESLYTQTWRTRGRTLASLQSKEGAEKLFGKTVYQGHPSLHDYLIYQRSQARQLAGLKFAESKKSKKKKKKNKR